MNWKKMEKLSFLQLAEKALKENKLPMTVEEIWSYIESKSYTSYLNSTGKTPRASMGAQMYVSLRDKATSPFAAVGERPKRFYLKKMESEINFSEKVINDPKNTLAIESPYTESQLHPYVVYFANVYLKLYCKTISHSKTGKYKYAQWLHPDIVGCYFPMESWDDNAIELSQTLGSINIKLYSFELKKSLSFVNLREAFFQAVSNSSWSHEGYLCAAEISDDEEFLSELKRLSGSFGIGVIKIDVEDPDSTNILYPSRVRDTLDWESINKLCINDDFSKFISRVNKDIVSKEIRIESFDKLLNLEELKSSLNSKR